MKSIRSSLTIALFLICCTIVQPVLAKEPALYLQVHTTAKQFDPFLQEMSEFLAKCKFSYLATCENNKPFVRPVGFNAFLDNQLIIATSCKKEMYRQMMANPEVDLSATLPDLSYFSRFHGQAKLCEDQEILDYFIQKFPFFKTMYGKNLKVFLIAPERAGIFAMKKGIQPKTKNFREKK